MTAARARIARFLEAHPAIALVEVREALGSTPREVGAWMLVSPDAIFGTIGGGLPFDALRDRFAQFVVDDRDVDLHPPAAALADLRTERNVEKVGRSR